MIIIQRPNRLRTDISLAKDAYQFEFSFVGGSWAITATSGPFEQTLYP
jgi:hypothetical protein